MASERPSLARAARLVESFGVGPELTTRVASLEDALRNQSGSEVGTLLSDEGIGDELVAAARTVKSVAGQINVVVHAVGILVSLPHILGEGEVVESLSLGAGNTGREHDLETDRRIAEFKFIDWRGGSEAIRQNNVFADVFNLAIAKTAKRRVLYVLGTEHPLRFLTGGRAITSILGRAPKVRRLFHEAYGGNAYDTVNQYWEEVSGQVELVDLRQLVPAFQSG